MVSEGNSAFSKANYNIAILKYKEALKVKSDETVIQKIKDANAKMAQLESDKANDAQFQALIQKGDNLVLSEKFDEAIQIYNQAKEVKPEDQLPYKKIDDDTRELYIIFSLISIVGLFLYLLIKYTYLRTVF